MVDFKQALAAALKGAPVREKMDAEFWSPRDPGETVLGRIGDFSTRLFAEKERVSFQLTPVLVYPKEGEPVGYAELGVSLNSWLKKLVRAADRGKVVAIIYMGKKDTPAGKMFTYQVRDVAEATLAAQLAKLAPGLELAQLPAEASAAEAPPLSDDDLPF